MGGLLNSMIWTSYFCSMFFSLWCTKQWFTIVLCMRPDLYILSTFSKMSSLLTIELIRLKPDNHLRNLIRRWLLHVSYRLSHSLILTGNYQQLSFNRINKLQGMLYSTRELIHSLDLTLRQCRKNVYFKTVLSVFSCKMLRHTFKIFCLYIFPHSIRATSETRLTLSAQFWKPNRD